MATRKPREPFIPNSEQAAIAVKKIIESYLLKGEITGKILAALSEDIVSYFDQGEKKNDQVG